jgi:hypothetical protein
VIPMSASETSVLLGVTEGMMILFLGFIIGGPSFLWSVQSLTWVAISVWMLGVERRPALVCAAEYDPAGQQVERVRDE